MPDLAATVISVSLGAMLFFSSVMAPTIFRVLAEDAAGRLLRAIFPTYFLVNGLVAIIAAIIAFRPLESTLLIVCGASMLAVRYVAIPIINNARDMAISGDSTAKFRFDRWHRATVLINAIEMVALGAVIYLLLNANRSDLVSGA